MGILFFVALENLYFQRVVDKDNNTFVL